MSRFAVVAIIAVCFRLTVALAAETPAAATAPVFVPDTTHQNDPLPDGVLAWESTSQAVEVAADKGKAEFTFSFTNITPHEVVILNVHPSCGCTTPHLPTLPWTIPAGSNGQIGLTVDIKGKAGILFKSAKISTDKGSMDVNLRITILPSVLPQMTDAERAKGLEMAKVDRQAVFQGDCASCHAKPAEGIYGKALYDAVCGVCHESEHRASMVPDLHNLNVPTNEEFWRTWITNGKAGSLMPAFSTAQGGPLNDVQIASLAAFLNATIPSKVQPTE